MRTVSWLFLILSFALGIGCAFAVRHYTFEAKPVQTTKQGPTTKILIAKRDIPRGIELNAEAVTFLEIPVAELPSEAAMSFAQIDRRRTAFPIPAGYPICGDLLLPFVEDHSEAEKFIPPGSQAVSMEINQIDLNNEVIKQPISITNYFSADQRIDIRILPKEKLQGELAERKHQLLKAFLSKDEIAAKGEVFLENVEIYQIQSKIALDGKQIQTLTLVLEKENAEKLIAAARKSRIRIIPHQPNTPTLPEVPVQPEVSTESVADSSVSDGAVTAESAASVLESIAVEIAASVPIVKDSSKVSEEQSQTDMEKPRTKLAFVPVTIPNVNSDEIHNDNFVESTALSHFPNFLRERNIDDSKPETGSQAAVHRSRSVFDVIEIGLPSLNVSPTNEKLNVAGPSAGYSPWGHSSNIASEPKAEKQSNESETPIQPLPLRSRKKVSQL